MRLTESQKKFRQQMSEIDRKRIDKQNNDDETEPYTRPNTKVKKLLQKIDEERRMSSVERNKKYGITEKSNLNDEKIANNLENYEKYPSKRSDMEQLNKRKTKIKGNTNHKVKFSVCLSTKK